MIWDPDWDGKSAEVTAGHGEKWERLNNWILLSWERFTVRLREEDEERERLERPLLTASEKSRHVERFRAHLIAKYGCSAVDQRWEAERANRLEARSAPDRKRP